MVSTSRQPVAFLQPSKSSPSSYSAFSCNNAAFADAPSITGYQGAGWGLDASFPSQAPPSAMSQHRRWLSEDGAHRTRERRSECRLTVLEPLTTPASVLPEQSYSPSSDLLRPGPYSNSYQRHSGDFSPSSWEDWSLEHDILPRINPTSGNGQPWASQLNVQIPAFPQSFDSLQTFSSPDTSSTSSLYTPNDQPIHIGGFTFPVQLSPIPSPSPSPVYFDQIVKPPPLPTSTKSRRGSDQKTEGGKMCSHCRATTTPLWRRDPSTMKPLCNACGLYLQQRNKLRPQELIDADDDGDSSEESDANYVGPECSHCHTHHTSVWRRSKSGDQLCNACGVYARLRGKPRPLSLKKKKIRPRSKHVPK